MAFVQRTRRDLQNLVRSSAAAGGMGLALACGAAAGMVPALASHSKAATTLNPYLHLCQAKRPAGEEREKACIQAPAKAFAGALPEGEKLRLLVKVFGGSGDYSFKWRVNSLAAGHRRDYTFVANNIAKEDVLQTISVSVKDLRRHVVLDPYTIVEVAPSAPAASGTASTITILSGQPTTVPLGPARQNPLVIPPAQPPTQTVAYGQSATIREGAPTSSQGAITYSWSEVNPSAAQSDPAADCMSPRPDLCAFQITGSTLSGTYLFSVLVKDSAGQHKSSSATVVVKP